MTFQITRKLKFDAGHRVLNHESKCKYPHGHEYKLEVVLEPQRGLDAIGRVVDFGEVKKTLQGFIDEHLDHAFIVYMEDKEMMNALHSLSDAKIYPMAENPTAENIAYHLLVLFSKLLEEEHPQALIHALTVHETSNCSATVVGGWVNLND
jgi:6-pyruvoyltetrahydropterin/6-carboxytetrahydropterin synthase